MAARVQIIVEAKDNASKNLKGLVTNFTDLRNVAQSVGQAMRQAYEFMREGADLALVQDRFDRLSESIGTTADALLTDLKDATRGLYSDFELMNSAMDFMALGLAKNHDEAVRLSAVASGLNMNMNQLVLTLTNMTTMRFDAIGVSVDGFKEKVKALEEQGLSAQDAFKEAFLQQAEGQLERVGHAADSTAGAFMRLEAQAKTAIDEMKTGLAETLGPVAAALADANDAAKAYNDEMERAENILKTYDKELYYLYLDIDHLTPEMRKLIEEFDAQVAAAESADVAMLGYANSLKGASEVMSDMGGIEMSVNYKDLISGIMTLQSESEKYAETQGELLQKKAELNEEIAEAVRRYGENSSKVQEMREKMGELNGEYAQNARDAEMWSKKTVFAMAQARAMADGSISAIEGEMLIKLGVGMDLFSDQTAEAMREVNSAFSSLDLGDEAAAIDALNRSVNNLSGTHYVNLIVNQMGDWELIGDEIISPGTGTGEFLQTGGPVYAGNPVTVGEAGAEPFFPSQNGRILGHAESLHALTMGAGGNYFYGPVTISPDSGGGGDLLELR